MAQCSPPFLTGHSARGVPRHCPPWPSSAWTPRWSDRWGGWASPPGPAPSPGPSEPSASGVLPQTPTGRPKDWAASPWTLATCLPSEKMGRKTGLLLSPWASSGRHSRRHPQNGSTFAGGGRERGERGTRGTCPPRSCWGHPGLHSGLTPAGRFRHRRPPRASCANKKDTVGGDRAIPTICASGAGATKHRR